MLLKNGCLSLLLSPRSWLATPSPRSQLATPFVQPAVPGTSLGREVPFLKYDNDDNFSNESYIGGDIIDSNFTEGLMSLPPVESKVTAYHAKREGLQRST
jgi:hypothetical protein